MNQFEQIAKKIWFEDGDGIKLVRGLSPRDRTQIARRPPALYGARTNLFAGRKDIKGSLQKMRPRSERPHRKLDSMTAKSAI